MKILFISHYFFPEGNAPATRVFEMARRWVKAGHEVTVLTAAPNVPAGVVYEGYENRWRHEEEVEGITVVRVWTYLAANAGTIRRILSYLSFMTTAVNAALRLPRPDVLVATTPQFFSGWAGRLTAAGRKLPFVLEVRDLWPESIVAVGAMGQSPLIRFLQWLESRLYRGADGIVTVGESYRSKLLSRGVDGGRVTVVPNGVDMEAFSVRGPSPDFLREFGLQNRFVCAYIGTIGLASGLDVVIRAGKILQDAGREDLCFLLVGDGADRARLQERVEDEGLRNVVLTGRLPKSRIPEVLASVDACLVHLLKRDLFKTVIPSKIFEAGAMQKPIILGVEGFAAEIVEDGGAGICIEPENESELIQAVDRLLERPDEAASMGKAGRELVSRSYNYDLLAADYLARIKEILDGA
jgi:glycosyltransferase involved in cell wall biosynthesis